VSVPYSQLPSSLLMDEDMTLSAIRAWHTVYVETLGRPGWDLTYQQIADRIGSDRRTAMRAIDLLLSKGWLIREKQKVGNGDAANLFIICREPNVPWHEQTPLSPPSVSADTPPSVTTDTHQKNHLPEEEQLPPPASREAVMDEDPRALMLAFSSLAVSEDHGFEQFWKTYPRKTGKAEAKKKFRIALRKVSLARMLRAVEDARATTWAGKEVQYIPHAATWLNQERWDDVPEKPAEPKRTKPKGDKWITNRKGEWDRNPEWDEPEASTW